MSEDQQIEVTFFDLDKEEFHIRGELDLEYFLEQQNDGNFLSIFVKQINP